MKLYETSQVRSQYYITCIRENRMISRDFSEIDQCLVEASSYPLDFLHAVVVRRGARAR